MPLPWPTRGEVHPEVVTQHAEVVATAAFDSAASQITDVMSSGNHGVQGHEAIARGAQS